MSSASLVTTQWTSRPRATDRDAAIAALDATFQDSDIPVWLMSLDGRSCIYTNAAGARLLDGPDGQAWRPELAPKVRGLSDDVRRHRRPAEWRARLAGREYRAFLSLVQNHHDRVQALLVSFHLMD